MQTRQTQRPAAHTAAQTAAQMKDALQARHLTGEIYHVERETRAVKFSTAGLQHSSIRRQTGTALRVLDGQHTGHAWRTPDAPVTPDELVEQALQSARLGYSSHTDRLTPTHQPGSYHVPPAVTLNQLTRAAGEHWRYLQQEAPPNVRYHIALRAIDETITRALTFDNPVTAQQRRYELVVRAILDASTHNEHYYSVRRMAYPLSLAQMTPETICQECLAPLQQNVPDIEPGTTTLDVILMPQAVGSLLSIMTALWHGHTLQRRISPFAGQQGNRVSNLPLTLYDDTRPGSRPHRMPFDGEGQATERTPLIENGILRGGFTSQRTAGVSGGRSTGNARRDFVERPTLQPGNLIVQPGPDALNATVAALQDGLLVHNVTGGGYTSVLNGQFSVKTTLAYRVQQGEITGRVRGAVLSGSFLEMLQRLFAIGDTPRSFYYIDTPFIGCERISISGKGETSDD